MFFKHTQLIQWRDERAGYAMHKLVHAWGQDRLELEQQQYLSLTALELLTRLFLLVQGKLDAGFPNLG